MPIFFVLSGFLLFRPWVQAPPVGSARAVGAPLRVAPGAAHHAGLRRHRAGRLPDLPLPQRRAQSRPHLDRAVPQPHADADLHRQLHVLVSAPGTYADVEPGGRGRRSTWRCRCWPTCCWWCCADGVGGRGCCWPGSPALALDHARRGWCWCTPPTCCPTARGCGCRRIWLWFLGGMLLAVLQAMGVRCYAFVRCRWRWSASSSRRRRSRASRRRHPTGCARRLSRRCSTPSSRRWSVAPLALGEPRLVRAAAGEPADGVARRDLLRDLPDPPRGDGDRRWSRCCASQVYTGSMLRCSS